MIDKVYGFDRKIGNDINPYLIGMFQALQNGWNPQKNIMDVRFTSVDYADMYIPPNSIIYCDPPYMGTTKYKDKFDSSKFWDWCDKMIDRGNEVFVSEYTAPRGWRCIWEKKVNNSLTQNTGSKKGIEKLFTK